MGALPRFLEHRSRRFRLGAESTQQDAAARPRTPLQLLSNEDPLDLPHPALNSVKLAASAARLDPGAFRDLEVAPQSSSFSNDIRLLYGSATGLENSNAINFTMMSAISTAPLPFMPPQLEDLDGDGAADLMMPISSDTTGSSSVGEFGLFLGGPRRPSPQTYADADVVFSGGSLATPFLQCSIGPDLDGGGIKDIFCAGTNGKTYIHLVEDTDNDGDLWSVSDCDADDNDPLVQ